MRKYDIVIVANAPDDDDVVLPHREIELLQLTACRLKCLLGGVEAVRALLHIADSLVRVAKQADVSGHLQLLSVSDTRSFTPCVIRAPISLGVTATGCPAAGLSG